MEFQEGMRVRVINAPDIIKYVLRRDLSDDVYGVIVAPDPQTDNYVVEVDGQRMLLPGDNLLLATSETYTLMNRVQAMINEQSSDTPSSPDVMNTDAFDQEIERLTKTIIEQVNKKVREMQVNWTDTIAQQLGDDLTTFIKYATQYLDRLVVMLELAKNKNDLKCALNAFKEILELSAEVANTPRVTAWVEMQLDQLNEFA